MSIEDENLKQQEDGMSGRTGEETEVTFTEHDRAAEESSEETEVQQDENAELVQQIDQLKASLDEAEDRNVRLQAEMANIRRRHQKEKEEDRKYRAQSLASDLLTALDNLERALQTEVEDEQGKNLKKGVEMVLGSLQSALEREGVEVIDPLGQPFDPNLHEAYTSVPSQEDQESGTVAQVFEKGYTLNGRILRAAKVAVTE